MLIILNITNLCSLIFLHSKFQNTTMCIKKKVLGKNKRKFIFQLLKNLKTKIK